MQEWPHGGTSSGALIGSYFHQRQVGKQSGTASWLSSCRDLGASLISRRGCHDQWRVEAYSFANQAAHQGQEAQPEESRRRVGVSRGLLSHRSPKADASSGSRHEPCGGSIFPSSFFLPNSCIQRLYP
uniref:Predicted protein n=1 Tax=Hordeum vulgare subsp. vulgare TaxID=112509 RepID=F2DBB8_HORVV|nr:predicted protein [Hordeum vulgare subsp. vulgare]